MTPISTSCGFASDAGRPKCLELVPVGLSHQLERGQGQVRFLLVDLRHGESDVDQHPIADLELLVFEQADVDDPGHPGHVNPSQVVMGFDEFHQLTRNPKTHNGLPYPRYSIDSSTNSSPPTSSTSTDPQPAQAIGMSSQSQVAPHP